MNWSEFGRMGRVLVEVLYRHFHGGTEKTTKKLRIAGFPAQISNGRLPNTSLGRVCTVPVRSR